MSDAHSNAPDRSPDDWSQRPIRQQPPYPDAAALETALDEVRALPPLVHHGEVDTLREHLAKAARGGAEGFADPHDFQIAAANLTATKARLLLMACLLKFGSYPPAKDPDNPTKEELDAIREATAVYQAVFNTH